MACSRPVVAYTGGSVREVIDGAGLVVENGDLEALTRAVAGLRQAYRSSGKAGALRAPVSGGLVRPREKLASVKGTVRIAGAQTWNELSPRVRLEKPFRDPTRVQRPVEKDWATSER